MDEGYVNRQGEVYSMEHVEEYMQTQEYQREHDQQSRKVADSLEVSTPKLKWGEVIYLQDDS
jgi:hypothetical protein